MISNPVVSSLFFCSFCAVCLWQIYLYKDSFRFSKQNYDLDKIKRQIIQKHPDVHINLFGSSKRSTVSRSNRYGHIEESRFGERRRDPEPKYVEPWEFDEDDEEDIFDNDYGFDEDNNEDDSVGSQPQCNCFNERCIVKFLGRFKGITTFPVQRHGQVGIKFIGTEENLELVRWELKRNKMEMIFGEPKHAFITTPKRDIINFLNAFTGIHVDSNGEVKFIGDVNQLLFVKRQLKDHGYEMIFGELEDNE